MYFSYWPVGLWITHPGGDGKAIEKLRFPTALPHPPKTGELSHKPHRLGYY